MSTSDDTLRFPRAIWHSRVQFIVFAWMLLAAAATLLSGRIDGAAWLATHCLLLGAVTNALFIWTWHFAAAILRVPDQAERGAEIQRFAVLNVGIVGVLIGVPTETPAITAAAGACVAAAVLLLAVAIRRAMRRALPSPYAFTASTYLVAAGMLSVGVLVAILHQTITVAEAVEPRIVLAHVVLNVLGWIGIPILGTIVTLWPTMLRTRIAPNAALLGRRMLPLIAASVPVAAIGIVTNVVPLALLGVAGYAVAFVVTALPMLQVLRQKPATSFATRSALAGMAWFLAALIMLGLGLLRWGVAATEEHGAGILLAAVAGGVLQVLLGCMSYLLPVVAAGGPAIVRWRNDLADVAGPARLGITNAGVVLTIAAPDGGRMPGAALLVAGLAWTAVMAARTLRTPSADEVAAAEAARPPLH